MIFSELYGAYYNIMADVLKIAVKRPPTAEEISTIISAKGFAETNLFFNPSLYEDRYKLLTKDGITPIHKAPSMPYTTAQKRWLRNCTTACARRSVRSWPRLSVRFAGRIIQHR